MKPWETLSVEDNRKGNEMEKFASYRMSDKEIRISLNHLIGLDEPTGRALVEKKTLEDLREEFADRFMSERVKAKFSRVVYGNVYSGGAPVMVWLDYICKEGRLTVQDEEAVRQFFHEQGYDLTYVNRQP